MDFAPTDESDVDTWCRTAMAAPVLTPDDETQLARLIQEGDPEACDRLVRANLRLVVEAARRHAGDGSTLLRFLQAGTEGLLLAVEAFDPASGDRFAENAGRYIERAMQHGGRRPIMIEGVTYRAGCRDEAMVFFHHWLKEAIHGEDTTYPHLQCIEEEFWGQANQYLVAVVDGQVVGVSGFLVRDGMPTHFLIVAVDPRYGENGIGRELTNRTLNLLVEGGRIPIVVDIVDERMRPVLRRSPHASQIRVRGEGPLAPQSPGTSTASP